MELPQYTVYVEVPRMLFPKTLRLIFLGMVLYLGVWLNFYFLGKALPFMVGILIMIGIVILLILSVIVNYTKFSNYQYKFFSNRVEFYGDNQSMIMYSQIRNLSVKKSLLDSLFHTGSIDMMGFSIRYVPNLNQVYFYVQKMVQMYGGGYPQQQQYSQQTGGYSQQQGQQGYSNSQQGYPQQAQQQYYNSQQGQQGYSSQQQYGSSYQSPNPNQQNTTRYPPRYGQ